MPDSKPKTDPRKSTPSALRQRMREAHQKKEPMDLAYEEVTGVINVALECAKDSAEEGIRNARALIRTLDSSSIPPKP